MVNRQNEVNGKVDHTNFNRSDDVNGWCYVSFVVLDRRTGQSLGEFEGWYCDAYERLMMEKGADNWNRQLHPNTHMSLSYVVKLSREGKLDKYRQ